MAARATAQSFRIGLCVSECLYVTLASGMQAHHLINGLHFVLFAPVFNVLEELLNEFQPYLLVGLLQPSLEGFWRMLVTIFVLLVG